MSDKQSRDGQPFVPVPTQVDFARQEEGVLSYWEDIEAFQKSVIQRPKDRPFAFYDGPPFASGLPHYGHLLASIVKDVVPRYWTMRGYRVERRFGWDCHGLPVENEAEQQLGLQSRRDILEYGVDRFNEACRGLVLRYAGEWERFIKRVGRWVDWSHQYRTMDVEFMESVWWAFKKLWEQGLIYEGYKTLAYCPRCATPLSNFEVNQGYAETQDPSLTVRFRVCGEHDLSILAWTTTPWTLPANMALAVGRGIPYVRVTLRSGERLILARPAMERSLKKHADELVDVREQPVDELLSMTYEPLFPYFDSRRADGAFRVLAADFVSVEDGTGIVHIAPGFGELDYQLGLREGVPVVCPLDEDCAFTAEVPDYQGWFVKDADRAILRHLRDTGSLFSESTLVHSYPFCWRCETPLIYRAVSTWFVKVEHRREQLLAANEQIRWVPEHIKHGRFGKWLEGARDWAISRNRYWGTPLPVWRNPDTGETVCVGSRAELERLSGTSVDDLHKHIIDAIDIPSPSGRGTLQRIPEVLDCWFESGSMPYAQNHYPFTDKTLFEASFPAEFISEGVDQTRGWFYTLTVLASALFGLPAFRNCIVTGMLLAEDGRKMSKRLKNYPEPTEMLDKYGADALRLYLLNSPALRAEELRITEDGIKESLRSVIIPLWNAYSFFVTYANIDGWTPCPEARIQPVSRLDRWILSELQTLVRNINTEMESYRLYRTVPAMVLFVDKLTNWYIRRSRRRFWKSEDDADKALAYATLYAVLVTLTRVLAPVLPFITEVMHQNLVRRRDAAAPESVHLCSMPQADSALQDEDLEEQMVLAMLAVTLGRSLRSKHNLKVRQPLGRLYLLPPDERSRKELQEVASLIADELNIKEVVFVEDETELSRISYKPNFRALGPRFGKRMKEVAGRIAGLTPDEYAAIRDGVTLSVAGGEISAADVEVQRQEKEGVVVAVESNLCVGLDVNLDDRLIMECTAREFVNRVQNMRRDAGLEVSDRIRIQVRGTEDLHTAVDAHRDYIAAETLAVDLSIGELAEDALLQQQWKVNELDATIAIARAD